MKEINKTSHMFPDHNIVNTAREGIKMAACPDCGCEVFTIRTALRLTHKEVAGIPNYPLTRFWGICINCGHQLILGEYDWEKEEEK